MTKLFIERLQKIILSLLQIRQKCALVQGRMCERADLLPPGAMLAFGSERRGLCPALLARADRSLAIPMRPGVSSLNLATAVAVVLYSRAWA